MSEASTLEYRIERNLQLHQNNCGVVQQISRRDDALRTQQEIGTRCYGNAVFTTVSNQDLRDSRWRAVIHSAMIRINPVAYEARQSLLAEHVSADASHQADISADPGRGHGLIGSLTTCGGQKFATHYRFAWRRDMWYLDDHVGIGRAHYDQLFHFTTSSVGVNDQALHA